MERQKSTSSNMTLTDIENIIGYFELNESDFIGYGGSISQNVPDEEFSAVGKVRSDSIHSLTGVDFWFEDITDKVGLMQKPWTAHSRRSSITGISSLSGGLNDFPMDVNDEYEIIDHDFDAVIETLTGDPVIPYVVNGIELADQNMCNLINELRSARLAKNKLLNTSMVGYSFGPDVVKSQENNSFEKIVWDETKVVMELDKSAHFVKIEPTVSLASTPKAKQPKNKNQNRYYNRVPKEKKYFAPSNLDVKLGRGGHVNGHHGNRMYLDKKMDLKERYSAATRDDIKTGISQELVDAVRDWGGKFLKEDEVGWYQVENIIARKKASQSLREQQDRAKKKIRQQFDGGT
jgi:hypothetical protein